MQIKVKETEELGIDWTNLCEVTGINLYAKNEGLADDDDYLDVSVSELKELLNLD